MAIIWSDEYPNGTNAPTSGYPFGSAKNESAPEALDGMPWEQRAINDWGGFFQSLLSGANLTPSGNPDQVGASQYLEALQALLFEFEVVELGGDFNSGEEVRCSRNRVTGDVLIASVGNIGHPQDNSANSAAGAIPAAYRPTVQAENVYMFSSIPNGDIIRKVRVGTDGTFGVSYADWTGAKKTSASAQSPTISYSVADT